MERPRPGGMLAMRPLHFIWMIDSNRSMEVDGKIQALNTAIRETIPHLKRVAGENPHAQILVRAITFSSGARWHVAAPTPIEDLKWGDVDIGGDSRDLGLALKMVAEQLSPSLMPDRALPPVLVLISDGYCTDDFTGGLEALLGQPWARRAVRIGIAIGAGADLDMLQRFIGHPELRPLQAHNLEALVKYIKWASIPASRASSQPTISSSPRPLPSQIDDVW